MGRLLLLCIKKVPMKALVRSTFLLLPVLLAACATTTPVSKDFPAGARAPSAAELSAMLRGKSYHSVAANGSTVRADYAANSDGVTLNSGGLTDNGKWRVEDGRLCLQMTNFPSSCSDIRLVGQDIYLKRANGDVVRATVAR